MWIIRIPMTRERIVKYIHEGIREAKKRYENDMRIEWIARPGGENRLVDGICKALCRGWSGGERPVPENSFRNIQNDSGAVRLPGRPPKGLGGDNRVDIALYNNQGRPTCIIEVKPDWRSYENCLNDIRRVNALLQACSSNRGGSLEYGFFAVLLTQKLDGQGRDMHHRVDYISRSIKAEFRDKVTYKLHGKDISREKFEGRTWQVSSLVVEVLTQG